MTSTTWQVSEALIAAPDQSAIDAFFRRYQPIVSREGERWVLSIPAEHNAGVYEPWASARGQSLPDFIAAIEREKSAPTQQAQEAA